MRISRKMKRSTKQFVVVAVICISVIGAAAVFTALMVTGQIREEYSSLLEDAYDEMALNQQEVFVVTQEIIAGECISEDNVTKKVVYSSLSEEVYMKEEQMGSVALVTLPKETPVLNNMLTTYLVSSELREMEYNVIYVNSNIKKSDTVDVRIGYPNGESYIVLSKKVLKGYQQDTASCFFWLDEEELLRMSAAIVDASLYSGSNLFVTKYIEPRIQEESMVTYTPSLSLLSLIETDPNIVERCSQDLNKEVRKALENRLASSMTSDVSEIDWNVDHDIFKEGETVTPIPSATPTPIPPILDEMKEEDTQNTENTENTQEVILGEVSSMEQEDNYMFFYRGSSG